MTPEELWNSGKRRRGRPHKTTAEEERLLEELARITVEIYRDQKLAEWKKNNPDKYPEGTLHIKHKS